MKNLKLASIRKKPLTEVEEQLLKSTKLWDEAISFLQYSRRLSGRARRLLGKSSRALRDSRRAIARISRQQENLNQQVRAVDCLINTGATVFFRIKPRLFYAYHT